jgi:hypothetical protein
MYFQLHSPPCPRVGILKPCLSMRGYLDIDTCVGISLRYIGTLERPPKLILLNIPIDIELLKELSNYPSMVGIIIIITIS